MRMRCKRQQPTVLVVAGVEAQKSLARYWRNQQRYGSSFEKN